MAPPPGNSGGLSFPEGGIGHLARRLCIVGRNHPLLFGYLTTLLRDRPAVAEQIDLVIDRRHGPPPKAPEVERRRPSNIDEELRQRGFAFVAEPGETFRPRDAARIEHTVELLAGMEDRSWPFRRRRPRPLLERVWGQRSWKTLAILGAVALISTMLAAEFRMNDLIEMDPGAPSQSRPTVTKAEKETQAAKETKVAKEAPPAPRMEPVAESTTAEARREEATTAATSATPPAPAASIADRHRVPGPAFSPPPEQASLAAALPPPAAETPRAQTPPPSLPTRTASARPAPRPAPPASAPALAAVATPVAPPAPPPSDLRIELSRRPTSATGGGVVYLVRVTDLSGHPLPDAKVWMQAGRRASGALFETRLFPAEMPGTYRSGVVHPSTLPPDLTVQAIVGDRRVEAPVER